MTSEQNTERFHMALPPMMKQDLAERAAKLGVSEAKLVRDALKAQGYGVRWSAPPPGVISEERPRGVSLERPEDYATTQRKFGAHKGAGFAERQRVLRAQMQPEA
jgi:hypothetical protein